jgi:NAD(P)-dependent dehydrogenase (short-subunit alcohol dehydrogenase family)
VQSSRFGKKSVSDLVVITGATGGIGRCIARQLHDRGLVPVIGHREQKASEARAIADSCGGLPVILDMNDPASINHGVEMLLDDGRPVAGVVFAASPPPVIAPFGKMTAADHSQFWMANVVGPHFLLAGLIRHCFRPRKAGSAVALLTKAMGDASSGADIPHVMSGMGTYTVSKFGLLGVIAQAKAEFPWLRVSSVKPGFTETEMLKVFDDRFLDQLRRQQEFSKPEDVAAEVIERLALNKSK